MFPKFEKKDILTVPNILSFVRLLLIPLIVVLYCVYDNYTWAAVVIVISGLTDVVDGKIARKYGLVSDFGKMLDPVADKLTQAAVLLCLVTRFKYMLFLFGLMFVKELFMAITGILRIRHTGEVYGADWHGKLNTVLLYTIMVIHIIWHSIPPVVSNIMIVVCFCVMALSMILYGIQNIKNIRS